jgi:integrase
MPSIKITKVAVDKMPSPEEGKQVDYFDTDLKGFGVRLSATGKTYFVMKRVDGKKVRVTIGKHGEFTPERARNRAADLMTEMRAGDNPNEKKRAAKVRGVTLQEVLDEYLAKRKLKPRTESGYKSSFALYLSDWLDLSVAEINREMVTKRHSDIANGKRQRGVMKKAVVIEEKNGTRLNRVKKSRDESPQLREASADLAMRILRAVLNYAFAGQEEEGRVRMNPVTILSRKKTWFRVARRRNLIRNTDLPKWHKAVLALPNPHMRDFLLFLLFTGLRRNEAARLKWSQVDFEESAFTIVDTKNKEPHTLPMSGYLYDMLKTRHQSLKENSYVFPSTGRAGYIQEPKRAIDTITANTGVFFTCHDLRRTFATIAESLDLSSYTVKALLNHKQQTGDVTGGYIQINVDRLREPMQKVSDVIKERIARQHGQIIHLESKGD